MNAAIDQRIQQIEKHVGHSVMEGAPDGWVPTEVAIVKGVTLRVVWVGALLAVGADVYWTPDAMAPAYWFPSTPE